MWMQRLLVEALLLHEATVQDQKEGTLILTYNTDEAMGFRASGGGSGCDDYFWDTLGINLSVD